MRETSVTIITNGFQPHYIIDLVNSLAKNNLNVDLLGSDIYNPDLLDPRIRLINIRGSHRHAATIEKCSRLSLYYAKLIKYMLLSKNKIYHIQWLRMNIFEGIIVNLLLKCSGRKIIYTAHNVLPHEKETVINKIVFYLIYRIVNIIIVHSESIKNRIVNEFKLSESKVKIVNHGVYNIKKDAQITKLTARETLGLLDDDKVILFFGNISKYKGIDILLNAFCVGENHIISNKLIIAGKIDPKFEKIFKSFYSNIRKNNIISFFDYVSDEQMEMIFKSTDVTILPYIEGSQSGVLFMSYAYGRPVIASDIGSFSHDIVQGSTGYIFQVGNLYSLVKTINNFFTSEMYYNYEKTEKDITNLAYSRYSWDQIGKELKSIYYPF